MVLDFLLGWTLSLPAWLGIFLIATIVSVIMTIIYKFTTNQDLMKDLKEELKEIQKQMKALKDNPQKMMQVQTRAMEINMKYMMHSFKPMLFSIIPIIFIFSWFIGHYSYVGLMPDQDFTVTVLLPKGAEGNVSIESSLVKEGTPTELPAASKIVFLLKTPQEPGSYPIKVSRDGEFYTLEAEVTLDGEGFGVPLIGHQEKFMGLFTIGPKANTLPDDSTFQSISLDLPKLHPLGPFSLFGWMPQAFGTYVIFSILTSLVIRKLMRVY